MPITCVGRFVGFSSNFARTRANPIVWEAVKDWFGRDPFALEQIKLYKRSSPMLADLYNSVLKYDRLYTRRPENDELLEEVLRIAEERFRPPQPLKLLHINDQRNVFPLSTSPCLPYVQQGLRTKYAAEERARFDARLYAHRIKEGESVHLPPSMVFAKGKICTKDVTKSRAIWGKSYAVLKMQAIFWKPYWDYALTGNTPGAYKYTPFHGGFTRLVNDLNRAGFTIDGKRTIVGLDFSAYDTSLPPWLLFAAYRSFSTYFDFGAYQGHGTPKAYKMLRLYWRLAREAINTPFLMPDGYMFKKNGGIDSGSYDFQQIENFCTFVMVYYAMRRLGRDPQFLSVGGDDSLCSLESALPIDLSAVAQIIKDVFGVEVNVSKSFSTTSLDEIHFLGRYLRSLGPRKTTADVILATLLPNNTDTSLFDLAERVVALYYDNAGMNNPAATFLKSVWHKIEPFIEHDLHRDHDWQNRWVKKFILWGTPPPPRLELPSMSTLFHLVYSSPRWKPPPEVAEALGAPPHYLFSL